MDTALGRSNWDLEEIAIYIPEVDHIAKVKLFKSSNGGTIGDGYGRFVDDAGH